MSIRVRFAPSPTGPLSLGNVRSALFNWLFARKKGGEFLLRIEDTDKERNQPEYERGIIDGLSWLGLTWDNADQIIRQSERIDLYKAHLEQLLKARKAYFCFCSSDDLEAERQSQMADGIFPVYSGRCALISPEESERRVREGERAVIRFRMPEATVSFTDLIRGELSFDTRLIGDIIIAKSITEPLYNFAVVVDDFTMGITHVIRGEDHLSNTPKQIVLLESLGFTRPIYAHLPLILGPDRKKLSKRYLQGSLADYKGKGYLPEAIINFLALLGWHPEHDKEIFDPRELVVEFTLERVQKGGAIFNPEKLEWLNAHYIRHLPLQKIIEQLAPFVRKEWLQSVVFENVVKLERERLRHLSEFTNNALHYFERPAYDRELLIWKESSHHDANFSLQRVLQIFQKVESDNFNHEHLQESILPFTREQGKGTVLWPLRVALSGKEASAGPFEIMEILGKEESEERIRIAIQKLEL